MLRAAALALALVVSALAGEDGRLPDEERVAYQTAYPQEGKFRMPTFMDVFAQFSQTEYINVGLKWSVAESKAAMAYATRASIGHAPIKKETDDYHIEAFAKSASPNANEFTKIRFRQKDTYSGSIGYNAPQGEDVGTFMVWDNLKKKYADAQVGGLKVSTNAVIDGDLTYKGKLHGSQEITTAKAGTFAGATIGVSSIGSKMEAEEGKGFAVYTRVKGGSIDEKVPRMFVNQDGNIGMGTTDPKSTLTVKSAKNAVRVEEGDVSIGQTSVFNVDGSQKGSAAPGLRFNIQKEGNIGVNTPVPEEKLHVGGSVKIDSAGGFGPSKAGLYVTNTLSGCTDHSLRVRDHFYVSACGRTGVRTPNPEADLHVAGTALTDNLNVNKDVKITGKLSVGKFESHAGTFESAKLIISDTATMKGKVLMESDVVMKGNLYVSKEVKMLGGDTGEEMMDLSSLLQIGESHKSLAESHQNLLKEHGAVQEQNKALEARVADLEKRLTDLAARV